MWRSACDSTPGSTLASVVRNASIVAMRGSIMPEPLAMPPTVIGPFGVSTTTAYDFGNGSVVMIARVAASWPSTLERGGCRRDARADPCEIERHADHAGRRDQDVLGRAAERAGGRSGHVARDVHPGLAGTRVRAAAVDDNRSGAPAGFRQVFARHDDRRGDGLVGREHGRGRDRLVGSDERKIQRRGRAPSRTALDAAGDARGAEAGGGSDASFDPTSGHGTGADHATTASRRAGGVATLYFATARSGRIIAYCPHVRNNGQPTQSVAIFSGTDRCGTMEKF